LRGLRALLAGVAIALLPTVAGAQPAAGHDPRFAMRNIDCQGLTVVGGGLPARSSVRLVLVNSDTGRVLLRRSVGTTASGRFATRMQTPMNGVLGMRVLIRSSSGAGLGFVDHTMTRGAPMCQLPFTGSPRPWLTAAAGFLVAAGAVLLFAARASNAYWPRYAGPPQRHTRRGPGSA
jgi:hypothetical protein